MEDASHVGKEGGGDEACAGILHGCCVCEVEEDGEQKYLTGWHRDSVPDSGGRIIQSSNATCSRLMAGVADLPCLSAGVLGIPGDDSVSSSPVLLSHLTSTGSKETVA